MKTSFDFEVTPCGSIHVVRPLTTSASEWLDDNVETEGWQMLGDGIACEPRCAVEIANGMVEAGLRGRLA